MIKRIEYGINECLKLSNHTPREIRCGVDIMLEAKHNNNFIYDRNVLKYKGIRIINDLNLSDEAIQIIIEDDKKYRANDTVDRFLKYINV